MLPIQWFQYGPTLYELQQGFIKTKFQPQLYFELQQDVLEIPFLRRSMHKHEVIERQTMWNLINHERRLSQDDLM